MVMPDNTISHTDIKKDGWIFRLPPRVRSYVLLARLDRPIGIWLLLLPAWWSIALAGQGGWGLYALFALGAVVMRAAGCVINDLWDRDLDSQVERTCDRPLASGALTARQGMVFLVGLLGVGLLILLQLPKTAIILGFLTIPLIVTYPLMKRVTWYPQAFLGLTFNFGALMGWAAVRDDVALPSFLLYAAGICWTLGYDTIYAHQDIEDDARIGIKSTARKWGRYSKRVVAVFYGLTVLFLGAALQAAEQRGWIGFALLALCAVHLAWQMRTWNPDDPACSLRIFKSNRDFGVFVLIVFLVTATVL
jgi:4-hydroxybenzoate polyprenyltransferase